MPYNFLFHDLLSAPMFHHSVWSVITAHKLTPAKRDMTTVVSDQWSRFTAPSIDDYNTPDTVAKQAPKVGHKINTLERQEVSNRIHK